MFVTTCSRLSAYTSNLAKRLYREEAGVYLTTELIILMTVLVFGLAAGLNAIAGSVNGELGDIAQAIQLDQSFSYNGLNAPGHATCSGSGFTDIDTPPVITPTPPFIPPQPPVFTIPDLPQIPVDQIEDIPLPQALSLESQVPVIIEEVLGVESQNTVRSESVEIQSADSDCACVKDLEAIEKELADFQARVQAMRDLRRKQCEADNR